MPTAAAAATGTTVATPDKARPTALSSAPTPEFSGEAYGREQPHDEEPAVSGWGGYEDEDGMGML